MRLPHSNSQLHALIRLLDDPDSDVYENVHGKLVSFGKTVIPVLESEWETVGQNAIQERIIQIIEEIEFEAACKALIDWKATQSDDLASGALIAATFQYPDIDFEAIRKQLLVLHRDVWIELNDNLTSLEKVRVINHILYDVHQFRPYTKYHTSEQSFFLNNLLDNHSGSPMTLGILYKVLADMLDLPIVGIDLPHHFILGYRDVYNHTGNELLFYINPYSKGAVFGRGELERYMEKLQVETPTPELKPMSNVQIVQRMLVELKACYQRSGKYKKMDEVSKLIRMLSSSNK
jgi:regulator of sirC expression with transglutaminase-like and TPR domain